MGAFTQMITTSARRLIQLTVGAMAVMGAYAIHSQGAIGANEHLKALQGYPGTWIWDWKDEHGQPMRGQSTVTLHPSGAYLLDRTSDVHEGKLTPTELNIYFWRSEAKAVGSLGFTSSGNHGSSTVVIRKNRWTEQSAGFDEEGVLRTHVDQWEWINADKGTYQDTHVVRGGRGEPDGFKLAFERAGPGVAFPSRDNRPTLNEHLKPLARLIGEWGVQWTNASGQVKEARSSVRPEAGGAVILQDLQHVEDGKVVFSELTVYFWQAESKSLGVAMLNSAGSSLAGDIFVRVDNWVSQLTGYNGNGEVQMCVVKQQWLNSDSAVCEKKHQFTGGQPEPDSPAFRFRRLPAP